MEQVSFQDQVRRCAAEFKELLPALSQRHPTLILIAALTEHVGGSLYISQQTRTCSPERARAIIERVKELAFAAA
jgi:hypothetical protein